MNLQNLNDGIVIFSDTGNVMFTSTGEIVENKKTVRKHKINKNIVHKNFDLMREYTDNDFWDRFLAKCARNIFPNKDFKFTNDVLYYKIKTKKHRSELFINEDNLEQSFIELKKFLRNKGIKPNSEVREKDIFFEKDIVEITQWKEIRKEFKYDKLMIYIEKLKAKYQLNYKESKQLESLLKTAVAGDILNNDNILIDNNEIADIKYLYWCNEKREFILDINNIPLKFSKSSKIKDNNNYYTYNSYSNDNFNCNREIESLDIGKKWEKFLDNFYNKK